MNGIDLDAPVWDHAEEAQRTKIINCRRAMRASLICEIERSDRSLCRTWEYGPNHKSDFGLILVGQMPARKRETRFDPVREGHGFSRADTNRLKRGFSR